MNMCQKADPHVSSLSVRLSLCPLPVSASVSLQIVPEDLRPVLPDPVPLESNRRAHRKSDSPARAERRSSSSRSVQVAVDCGRSASLTPAQTRLVRWCVWLWIWGRDEEDSLRGWCVDVCIIRTWLEVTNGSRFTYFSFRTSTTMNTCQAVWCFSMFPLSPRCHLLKLPSLM